MPRWVWASLGVVGLALGGGATAWLMPKSQVQSTVHAWWGTPTERAEAALQGKPFALPEPVLSATRTYLQRGGTYDWGPNDCSTFVTDYMTSAGMRIGRRLTTADLASEATQTKLRLQKVDGPRDGAIFVWRYQGRKGERGHTGVVVQQGRRRYFVHNAASAGGFVIDDEKTFERRVLQLGIQPKQVTYLRMPVG